MESVKLATKNGQKIPDNIIATDLIDGAGELLSHSDLTNTVLLEATPSSRLTKTMMQIREPENSPQLNNVYDVFIKFIEDFEKSFLSTNHPLHTVMHEFNHIGQTQLMSERFRKIPKEFETIYKKISGYASEGIPGEIEAELLTKKQLAKLSPEEERLLSYLS